MRSGTPSIGAVIRTLDFLERIVADRGVHGVLHLAEAANVPPATAHRQVRTLVTRGYLTPIAKGRHVAGPRLMGLGRAVDPIATLAHAARLTLRKLAIAEKATAHLGVLEGDMVTYLVKVGGADDQLFTEEGKQLEAYCSGVGKVLLAHLHQPERDDYLADGPFTALTPHTITDPARLRTVLENARARGFAVDDQEMALGVQCVAAPLLWPDGGCRAAISLTRTGGAWLSAGTDQLVPRLQAGAAALMASVFGR